MSEVGSKAPQAKTKPVEPIGAEEFATLLSVFGTFTPKTVFAVAVSGGPDSMALAFLMKQWASAHGHSVQAFIVDHALRTESADEAAETQKRLATLDIPATILRWEHGDVTSRIHVTARRARYELLTKACKNAGISHLLLAHQREDQAETIAMRLAKGSGIDGLSGIASVSTKDGVQCLRPLLSIAKERLIATCDAAKISYVTDPSNLSEKYARGRLRRLMPLLAEEGLTIDRLVDLGERAATARDALYHYTNELLARTASLSAYGVITIKRADFLAAPRGIIVRALTQCLQAVHTADYAPELQSLSQLIDALNTDGETSGRTLHGCLVSRHDDTITILRELSHVAPTQPIHAGETVLWDGRWLVTLKADFVASKPPYTLRPLGNPPHDILDKLAPKLRHDLPQGRARATLPSLWQGGNLLAMPSINAGKADDSLTATLATESIPSVFRA